VTLPRLLAGAHSRRPVSLAEHVQRHGRADARSLVELVSASGLRGRGGGGFPTGEKLKAVRDQGGRAVVVANGTEGEPASGKDKALLRSVPHLVLDGAALAAEAVGADEAIVALGADARRELRVLDEALAERRAHRVDGVAIRLARVPNGFVCGEETALVSSLNGKPPKPTTTPPRPFERGVGGRPTLVQNVETLAHLALVARHGPEWFRAVGTRAEPGSILVTLGGAVARPGVLEAALGTPLRAVVAASGGTTAPVRAYLVGGYFGTWVAADDAERLRLLDADLAAAGAALGAGTIVALPQSSCGLVETARVARYLADSSAGQCGPCVHGLGAIAGALERIARGKESSPRLVRWLEQVRGRGACRHPDGASRFVSSALTVFAAELENHARGRCTGGGRPILPVAA
jgi:NADH:ubiquinone oxidoreductase subunit F (NADH-binding)